jgi:hypothetical protein
VIVYRVAPREGGQDLDRSIHVGLPPVGRRQSGPWVPFDVELVSRRGRRALEPVDAMRVNGDFLVVKDAALPRVERELAPYVEFLPLRCAQEPLTMLNVLQVADALDEEESQIKRFRDGGIMRVDRFVFRPEAVPTAGLFRVPQSMVHMLCAQDTADMLRDRLAGLDLEPLWEG